MKRRAGARLARVVGAAACATLTFSASALAAGSSIALKGPHMNLYGTSFHYTASGHARSSANYVYGWEVPYTPTCASTYKAESKRGETFLFVSKSIAKGKRFSLVINFLARNTERHRFCIYVINKASGKTLARAQTTWTNYAPLEPTGIGSGDCQAKKFPDESAYAQIDVKVASCETAEKVAYGADAAKGASYKAEDFSCSSTTEGPGSKWASGWTGTYYAYKCTYGKEGVAFNWGTDYAYVPAATLPTVTPGG